VLHGWRATSLSWLPFVAAGLLFAACGSASGTAAPPDSSSTPSTTAYTSTTTSPIQSLCARETQLLARESQLNDDLNAALANHSPDAARIDAQHQEVQVEIARVAQQMSVASGDKPVDIPSPNGGEAGAVHCPAETSGG